MSTDKVVAVYWRDAMSVTDYVGDVANLRPINVCTVGLLLKLDEDCAVVSSNVYQAVDNLTSGKLDGIMIVPAGMIVDITYLGEINGYLGVDESDNGVELVGHDTSCSC